MGQSRMQPQGVSQRMLRWAVAVIAFVGLAAAFAATASVRAQQVAQVSDFFKDQEKLRRESQRLRRGNAAAQTKQDKKKAERPKRKKQRRSEKPRQPTTTGASKRKTTESDNKPPKTKSQEARQSKPAPEEPKKPAAAAAEVPSGLPAYIRAKRPPVVKVLGAEIAEKIFSHEFTPVRQLAISRSARVIPGYECPRDPPVALTDIIPFKVKTGVISWIEGYVVGCKPRTKRSFLVMLQDGKPQFAELLPGLSIADPLLQRDAVPGAQASAKTRTPDGCDKAVVSDTRLAEPLTGAGRPWVELWTVDQCGTERRIEMRFTPSQDGGTRWAAKPIK